MYNVAVRETRVTCDSFDDKVWQTRKQVNPKLQYKAHPQVE